MYNKNFSKNFISTNIPAITIIINYYIIIVDILYICHKYIAQVMKYNRFSILKANIFYFVWFIKTNILLSFC